MARKKNVNGAARVKKPTARVKKPSEAQLLLGGAPTVSQPNEGDAVGVPYPASGTNPGVLPQVMGYQINSNPVRTITTFDANSWSVTLQATDFPPPPPPPAPPPTFTLTVYSGDNAGNLSISNPRHFTRSS
jgi:hypothetical protein